MLHGQSHPIGQVQAFFFISQGLEALDNDKHVVNANAQEQEGQGLVHGTKEETHVRAQTVGDDDAHDDAKDAGNGKVRPLLHAIHLAQHDQDVNKDDAVAHAKLGNVTKDGGPSNVSETSHHIRVRL